jgi:hypothetical protein
MSTYKNKINSYPANVAFRNFNASKNCSDYIKSKKTKYSFCTPNICHPNKNIGSSSNLLSLKYANNLAFYNCVNKFDPSQLYSSLYTEINLNGVNSYIDASSNSSITLLNQFPPTLINTGLDISSVPYSSYIVDPSGVLFGNSICGQQNWENYVINKFNV